MKTENINYNNLRNLADSTIIMGKLISAIGIVLSSTFFISGDYLSLVIGFAMVFGGFVQLSFAVFNFAIGPLIHRYLHALVLITTGVWVVSTNGLGLQSLTIVVAVYFVIDGFISAIYSLSLLPTGGAKYLFFSGFLVIIFGILIWLSFLGASQTLLILYTGIKFFIDGITLSLIGKSNRQINIDSIKTNGEIPN